MAINYETEHPLQGRVRKLEAENTALKDRLVKLQTVYKHARGICFGTDWNKGTHAGHHRKKLIRAVHSIEPLPKSAELQTALEWQADD